MDDWDWDAITVVNGEWWLLIIALIAGAILLAAGYAWGSSAARRGPRHEEIP